MVVGVQHDFSMTARSAFAERNGWRARIRVDGIDGEDFQFDKEGRTRSSVILDRCEGGGGHPSPAMQCCAASANQLSAAGQGAGPEYDSSQGEFSVRHGRRE